MHLVSFMQEVIALAGVHHRTTRCAVMARTIDSRGNGIATPIPTKSVQLNKFPNRTGGIQASISFSNIFSVRNGSLTGYGDSPRHARERDKLHTQ